MSVLSRLWEKLAKSKEYRHAFVVAQIKRGIPRQIRVLRKQRGWNQSDLAREADLTQGALSRAEDPDYGNLTINNILKIASGLDVAFVARFVPFSELAKWECSLSDETQLQVPSFEEEDKQGRLDTVVVKTRLRVDAVQRNIGTLNVQIPDREAAEQLAQTAAVQPLILPSSGAAGAGIGNPAQPVITSGATSQVVPGQTRFDIGYDTWRRRKHRAGQIGRKNPVQSPGVRRRATA